MTKRINIGIVNLMATKKMGDAFNSKTMNEVNDFTTKVLEIIESSPILRTEFKIFNNLRNKHIENELAASRYIDNNIKLMEVYTLREIDAEHEKLGSLINEDVETVDQNLDLYVAINNLITESLNDNIDIDVDVIHESQQVVLKHIMSNKPKENIITESDNSNINEEVIEIAIDKFNKKYELMEESDRLLLTKLIKTSDDEKKLMLEEIKKENLTILENVDKTNINEKVEKTIKKLNEMKYNKDTIIDDIVSLHELNKALL